MSKKISELEDVSALTGNELIEIVKAGANYKGTLDVLFSAVLQVDRTTLLDGNMLVIRDGNESGTRMEFHAAPHNMWMCYFVTDTDENAFQVNTQSLFMRSQDVTNSKGGTLTIDGFDEANGAVYKDHDVSPTGIKYYADYSATFTDRSLVDKAYVDAAIAAALNP